MLIMLEIIPSERHLRENYNVNQVELVDRFKSSPRIRILQELPTILYVAFSFEKFGLILDEKSLE